MTKQSRSVIGMEVLKNEKSNFIKFKRIEGPSLEYWKNVRNLEETILNIESRYLDWFDKFFPEETEVVEA